MTDVTISSEDLAVLLAAWTETRDVCGSPEPCPSPDCVRRERLAAALEAARSGPSASETPDEPVTGSRDDPTSAGLSDALTASALKAWKTAREVDGLSQLEAMRAALAVVVPYIQQQERRRAEQLALRWLAPPIGREPIEVVQGFRDAIKGDARG